MAAAGIDVNLMLDAGDGAAHAADWIAELELQRAWVTAGPSCVENPLVHDEALNTALRGSETLRAIPVLVPPTATSGTSERLRCFARETNCRVVRLCPTGHGYPLIDWVLSPLPELCERERISLILDFQPAGVPWDDVVRFARRFASLPMVLLGVRVGVDRVAPAALDNAANLVLEVREIGDPDGFAHLVDTYGASRFVWGTGGTPDGVVARDVIRLRLDREAADAVLSGNAEALASGDYGNAYL
jgi:hypothetical protein